jgi:two-component system response regulator YesN
MGSSRDVLILDDEPLIVRMLARLLRPRHVVRLARTPEEAQALLEQRLPDVLLCDFQLERCTTTQLLRQVKARWPQVRCVLHSGSHAELWAGLLKEGVIDSVLVKPASIQDILASLNCA